MWDLIVLALNFAFVFIFLHNKLEKVQKRAARFVDL